MFSGPLLHVAGLVPLQVDGPSGQRRGRDQGQWSEDPGGPYPPGPPTHVQGGGADTDTGHRVRQGEVVDGDGVINDADNNAKGVERGNEKEWYYGNVDKERNGPISFMEMKTCTLSAR